jgi:hypothetical protein
MSVLVFLFADLTPTSAVLLAVSLFAAWSVPYFLLVDAECWPQFAVHTWHDANWAYASGQHYVGEFARDARTYAAISLREAALTAAALLALLTINPGATR